MNLWWRLLRLRLTARRRGHASMWEDGVTRFRVAPTDLDVVGHMNNGRYLTLLDLGRYDLMKRSGFWATCRSLGWFPVVAGQTITYFKDLRLGQSFDVHTQVVGLDDRWVYLRQDLRRGDVLHARAMIRACFIGDGRRVSVEELVARSGEPPAPMTVPEWVRSWSTHTADRSV